MKDTQDALDILYKNTTEEKFLELKSKIEEAQNVINNADIEAAEKLKKATEKIDIH